MTVLARSKNVGVSHLFRTLFKPRDLFLHDGKALRRFRVGAGLQASTAAAAAGLLAWSVFSATQLATAAPAPDPAQIAQLKLQVAAMQRDVAAIKIVAQQRFSITEAEIRRVGLKPERLVEAGMGGPYEPVATTAAGGREDPNFRALFASWKKLEQLEQGTVAIPSAMPVQQTVNYTSGFGVRSDPFRGRAAMHPGVDLAGPIGTAIYATADGMVDRAEWNNGGYGNMVEIDHGHGIQTRYGHLTRYVVSAGQHVKRGDLIAYMGSTGRSTGSHLHYEVRLDGRAVNPLPFMQSSDLLQSVQRRIAAADQVAIGGPEIAD
jgi:murein DD-endopeptidase MepM/ murein hydrolase activator NlpD